MPSNLAPPGNVLNDDVLRHIASFLLPSELAPISHATHVFFDEHMKKVYTSLTFRKRDKQVKKLLLHLADRNANVTQWVRQVHIHPWLVQPRTKSPRSLTEKGIILLSKLFDADYTTKMADDRLQKRLKKDVKLVTDAFHQMHTVEEYGIYWDDDKKYHPELYRAFVLPVLTMWSDWLLKLTIKVPPKFLNSLASVRLPRLETFCFTFSTANLSAAVIKDVHTGFVVFVNNLKFSLRSLSFMSTNMSENLDVSSIFRDLGTFPLLQRISISLPYDGGQLSKPQIFVQFVERHRQALRELNLFTNRITVCKEAGDPNRIEWIQRILASFTTPFPFLQSLGVALRPLRYPLKTLTSFLDNHTSTLRSLKLMDRSLAAHDIGELFRNPHFGQLLAHNLTMLYLKVDIFDPYFLFSIARYLFNLETLQIACNQVAECWSMPFCFSEAADRPYLSAPAFLETMQAWNLRCLVLALPNIYFKRIEPYLQEILPHVAFAPLAKAHLSHGQVVYY